MSNTLQLINTIYSVVHKPDEDGPYEYGLEFYFEGFKEPALGGHVKAFFTMTNMYNNQLFDLLSCQSTFHFVSEELTDEDVLWVLNTTYDELKKYPLAEAEDIKHVLSRFPIVSHETAKLKIDYIKNWFYENI